MNILIQPFYPPPPPPKKGGGGISVANITDNHIMVAWFIKASMNVFCSGRQNKIFWICDFTHVYAFMYSVNLTNKYILFKTFNFNITIQLLYIKKFSSFSNYYFVHINISWSLLKKSQRIFYWFFHISGRVGKEFIKINTEGVYKVHAI